MIVRPAEPEELDLLYMMGYDVWSDGVSERDYLEKSRSSQKYKSGTGYLLADQNKLVSSLIVYTSGFELPDGFCGFGSVATDPACRGFGYASYLVTALCQSLERGGAKGVFLHSDVDPRLYERLGFKSLNAAAPSCMLRLFPPHSLENAVIPNYF